MRMLWILGCVVAMSAAASTAKAQPAQSSGLPPAMTVPGLAAPVEPEPGPETKPAPKPGGGESYRWQIALVDVSSVALLLSGTEAGAGIASLAYLVGGPIIHGTHDQPARIGASLALRFTLPLALAFGGAQLAIHNSHCAAADNDCDTGALGGAFLGLGVGVLGAMVIDTMIIAEPTAPRRSDATWVPQVHAAPGRVGLGIAGRF